MRLGLLGKGVVQSEGVGLVSWVIQGLGNHWLGLQISEGEARGCRGGRLDGSRLEQLVDVEGDTLLSEQ